jgi:hypothetical protein
VIQEQAEVDILEEKGRKLLSQVSRVGAGTGGDTELS